MRAASAGRDDRTVHPHGRGDNAYRYDLVPTWRGSPPRAWGQCGGGDNAARIRRFTPTGVGTILRVVGRRLSPAVHPHGRGDNIPMKLPFASKNGSPPRAWGQSRRSRVKRGNRRFTPTGVGTISHLRAGERSVAVHPHGRGDNRDDDLRAAMRFGSPPRAWGQWWWRRAARR